MPSSTSQSYERMLNELASGSLPLVLLGCRTGAENDLVQDLRSRGLSPTLRYLGALAGPAQKCLEAPRLALSSRGRSNT